MTATLRDIYRAVIKKGLAQMPTEAVAKVARHKQPMLLDGRVYDHERGCG